MEEHQIRFIDEMVRAILDGRKTQTRRPIKVQPSCSKLNQICTMLDSPHKHCWGNGNVSHFESDNVYFLCPFGIVGDRLWVRETFLPKASGIIYRADLDPVESAGIKGLYGGWKPSIHMPRSDSRITLEITNIRVERIQDISEKDAIAEGVSDYSQSFKVLDSDAMLNKWARYSCVVAHQRNEDRPAVATDVGAYAMMWDSMYEYKGFEWSANPWVWVIEFEIIADK